MGRGNRPCSGPIQNTAYCPLIAPQNRRKGLSNDLLHGSDGHWLKWPQPEALGHCIRWAHARAIWYLPDRELNPRIRLPGHLVCQGACD